MFSILCWLLGNTTLPNFQVRKLRLRGAGGLLATPTGVSRVHCCLNSYEARAGGCLKYKRVSGGCPDFSAHGCRDLSGGLLSHPAGHWDKGEAQGAGPGRWAASQMHPTSNTCTSPPLQPTWRSQT